MAVSSHGVGPTTAMGAQLVEGGVTFRTWAPNARDVYLIGPGDLPTAGTPGWTPNVGQRLSPLGDGTWAGFAEGLRDGDEYLFWVRGAGREGFKRDPYARELGTNPSFPDCPCIIRRAHSYPWHDGGWHPPAFRDLIIYQLHIGAFWAVDAQGHDQRCRYGRFLDTIERVPYLRDLGVTAVQFLPIQEYDQEIGLGYNGLDYFSPEMAYQIEDSAELARHLLLINLLLAEKGQAPLAIADLTPGPNQLKCLIDLCHLYGLAVIFDLVYNHAGGGFGDRSLAFYDRQPDDGSPWAGNRATLYFGNGEHAGGLVFDYRRDEVRQVLIDNARFFLDEYRIDGIRYDQVSVATEHAEGDRFCRDIADTVRYHRPSAIQIAEYWNWDRARAVTPASAGGLSFDAALADGLRNALWQMLSQSAGGRDARVELDRVRDALYPPTAFPNAWRAVQSLETHDEVLWNPFANASRHPRVPARADPSCPQSWYARSRSRVATALLFVAPGIPMLFMGQESLEPKPWSDDVKNWARFLISWDWLANGDSGRHYRDFHCFVTDLVHLRRTLPALRGDGVRVPQVHEVDRVLVLHRWVEGEGHDAVVVASLNESTLYDYPVEMPWPGRWREIFNSDVYDHFPNPWVTGNSGAVDADGPAGRTYPYTARMVIPANGILVFMR